MKLKLLTSLLLPITLLLSFISIPVSSFAGVQVEVGQFEYDDKGVQWMSEYGSHSSDKSSFDDVSPAIRLTHTTPSGLELSAGVRIAGRDMFANVGEEAQADIDAMTAVEDGANGMLAGLDTDTEDYKAQVENYTTIATEASNARTAIYNAHKRSDEQVGLSLQAMYFKPFGSMKVGAGAEYFTTSDTNTTVAKVAVKSMGSKDFNGGFEVLGNGDFVGIAFTSEF